MVKIRHLGRALLGLAALFAFSTGAKADNWVIESSEINASSSNYTYTSSTITPSTTPSGTYVLRLTFLANNGATSWYDSHPCIGLSDFQIQDADGTLIDLGSSASYTTNAQESSEGPITYLYDTNDDGSRNTGTSSFWHSNWSGADVGDYHYLQIEITDATALSTIASGYKINWTGRSNATSTLPTRVLVLTGSSSDDVTSQYEALKGGPAISSIDGATWDNSKLYVVRTGETSRGCWYYNSNDADYLNSTNKASVTEPTIPSFTFDELSGVTDGMKFAFIKKQVGDSYHYYAYSPAANKFLTYSSTDDGRVALVDKPTSIGSFIDGTYTGAPFVYVLTTTSAHHVGISNTYTHGVISFWNSQSDGGNCINLYDINENASGDDFEAAVAAVAAVDEDHIVAWWTLSDAISSNSGYTISNELNAYTDNGGSYTSTLNAANSMLGDSESTCTATTAELSSQATALTNAAASLTINTPADGSFIRVRCTEYGMSYLYSENATVSGYTSRAKFGGGGTVESIFYYKDGKLVGFNNGYKLSEPSADGFAYFNEVQDGLDISFIAAKNGTKGQYNVTYPFTDNNSTTRYMYTRSTTSDDVTYYFTDGANNNYNLGGCNYWIESVTTLPVTITSACGGYATFYTPVDVTWSDADVTAWQGKLSDDGKYLDLTEVTGTIPAGSAVLLKSSDSSADKTVEFTVASSNSAVALEGNILTGDYAAATVSGTPYTLQPVDGTPGFYRYTGTVLKGFKGYMASSQGVLGLRFGEDVTGIATIDANGNVVPSVVYDLSGRRVNNASNGIYIVNGKKVLVK